MNDFSVVFERRFNFQMQAIAVKTHRERDNTHLLFNALAGCTFNVVLSS
jgi:hypothetical protein